MIKLIMMQLHGVITYHSSSTKLNKPESNDNADCLSKIFLLPPSRDYLLNQITILQLSNILHLHHQSFQYHINHAASIKNTPLQTIVSNVYPPMFTKQFQISKAPDDPASNTHMPRKDQRKERRLSHTVTQDIYRTSPPSPLTLLFLKSLSFQTRRNNLDIKEHCNGPLVVLEL
jgi:hypothetical protein